METGRKLNVHKTFRRCPGRLLSVLCTINVRPVSTGIFHLLIEEMQSDLYFSEKLANLTKSVEFRGLLKVRVFLH